MAPHFPTPTTGTVIYCSVNAAPGGDGSKAKPFSTLSVAVDAAGKLVGVPVTIVLRAGQYYTQGIVLSAAHSSLTIQNFEGEAVSVTGAVAVPAAKAAWTVHNASTNTWRLSLADWKELPGETYGLRVGTRRAIRARYPDGDPETLDLGYSLHSRCCLLCIYMPAIDRSLSDCRYSLQWLKTFPTPYSQNKDWLNATRTFFAHPSDWPGGPSPDLSIAGMFY